MHTESDSATPRADRFADGLALKDDSPGARPASSESCVLLVDDEPEILTELAEMLGHVGYPCATATSAREAMEKVHGTPSIEIVLTDLRMPDLDGIEMAESLLADLARDRQLALIVVTAFANTDEVIRALRLGAVNFLTKPVRPDDLVQAIREAESIVNLQKAEKQFTKILESALEIRAATIAQLSRRLDRTSEALVEKDKKLNSAAAAKQEFLSLINHELRTPIGQIVGFAELLLAGNGDNSLGDKDKEFASKILSAGKSLSRLVDSMLTFLDLKSDNVDRCQSELFLDRLLGDICVSFGPMIAARGVSLRTRISNESLRVRGSEVLLKRAIANVVVNALDASDSGSDIEIKAVRRTTDICIEISDRGIGMTEDEISRALQLFRQVDGGWSRGKEGLGLGLPLAKRIIEVHDGRLHIESTRGQGTLVSILLPAMRQETKDGRTRG